MHFMTKCQKYGAKRVITASTEAIFQLINRKVVVRSREINMILCYTFRWRYTLNLKENHHVSFSHQQYGNTIVPTFTAD